MKPSPAILRPVAAAVLVTLAVNLLAALYIRAERAVYYWDFANYWNQFDLYAGLLRSAPVDALRTLIGSVKYAEYNGLAAFAIAPLGAAFGTSRLVYVLAVATCYALPAAAAAAWAARGAGRADSARHGWVVFALAITAGAWWHPVLRGFLDIGALIPAFLVAGLWLRFPAATWTWRQIALAGVLMACIILFRRIFAYWVVGFGVAAVAVDALPALLRADTRRAGLVAAGKLAAAAAIMTALMLTVAGPMTVAMVRNDYTAMYAMYQTGRSALAQAGSAAGYFGLPLALAVAAGIVLGLRDPARRRSTAFWMIQVTVGFLTLIRVTDFHRHHYYVLLPGLLLLAATSVATLRARAGALLAALFAAGSALAFLPALAHNPPPLAGLLSPAPAPPMHRGDLPALHRLLAALQRVPGTTDPARGVYVLSSSEALNDELLRASFRVLPPLDGPRPVIRATANKDEARFGFPRDLLAAAVVVVADPLQIHVSSPEKQAVITAPWRVIRDSAGFGGAYETRPETFTLDRGVTLRLFVRNGTPVDAARLRPLEEEFLRLRPATQPGEFDFSPPAP